MSAFLSRRPAGPLPYVVGGVLLGAAYAWLNTQTDNWQRAGDLGRAFKAFHSFVDRGIPLVAGALLGLSVHWMQLRGRLARAESLRVDQLRSRLRHVERDQAVWVVAASALHELKNPLHALGLLVDELEEVAAARAPERLRDHVHRVRALMDRTLVPLDALRSLTRRGRRTRAPRPIGPTVEEVVVALLPLAAEVGVALRLVGDRHATAAVDAEYVRIILDNLVANALEGDGEDKPRSVVVEIADEPGLERVVVRVSDDGPGLRQAGGAHAFDALGSEKVGGLGLGLPIAHALARALGGELAPASVPGFATSFELVLPATEGSR